ncbi:hypothetical protein GCM10027029_14810 [Conyzicola lurida]
MGAGIREPGGDRESDALGRSGDEGRGSSEIEFHALILTDRAGKGIRYSEAGDSRASMGRESTEPHDAGRVAASPRRQDETAR